jgi:hypothetical protein
VVSKFNNKDPPHEYSETMVGSSLISWLSSFTMKPLARHSYSLNAFVRYDRNDQDFKRGNCCRSFGIVLDWVWVWLLVRLELVLRSNISMAWPERFYPEFHISHQ